MIALLIERLQLRHYYDVIATCGHFGAQLLIIIMSQLSGYVQKLSSEAKQRYLNKLQLIGGIDPFCIQAKDHPQTPLPPVDASDLVSYFVLQTSYISAKQFKAHKSYNQFTNGWIKGVQAWSFEDKIVITGKVSVAS